jgi:putative glutamine amidotransferase
MEKPLIGISPLWDEERDSLWMLPGYMEGITQAGGIPLVLPLTTDAETLERLSRLCAGFLFTGGQDIAPARYGAEVSPLCGRTCEKRDAMEAALFSLAVMEQNKPALGICRGIQFFNVQLGGTLYQDIPTELPHSSLCHQQRPPYTQPAHQVRIHPGSPLHRLVGTELLSVNSSHHQGIARLAPDLTPMAEAEDGLVEAVYMQSKAFVWAVQWHPEMSLSGESSGKIFAAFLRACR